MMRRYAVDDVDFEQYQSQGGPMTRAEFFNLGFKQ